MSLMIENDIALDLPDLPKGYRWAVRWASNSPNTRSMFITLEEKKFLRWKEVRKALVIAELDETQTIDRIESGAINIYNSYFREYNPDKFIGVYQ